MEEKDQELLIEQSTGPPLEPVLQLTSYCTPPTIVDSVSLLALNLLPHLPPISEKSPLSNPLLVFDEKGKVRIEAPPNVPYIANLPPPISSDHGDYSWDKFGCATWHRSIEARGTKKVL